MQKRVLTGKQTKLTPEEKIDKLKESQVKRDEYENKNLENFEKIFPIQIEEEKENPYKKYLEYS